MALVLDYLPTLLQGLLLTLQLALCALFLACAFGLAGAAAKLSRSPAARAAAGAYTTLIRGVPDLMGMLLIFYGGQSALNALTDALGWGFVDVPAFAAGALTLGFIYGAYLTETFRGAVLAVPKGQAEAAASLGLAPLRIWRRIVLPQMVRHAAAGFTNTWLVMIKATALVSLIGLDDLMSRAGLAATATRQPFTFYAAVALIYLALTSVSLLLLARAELRFSRGVKKAAF